MIELALNNVNKYFGANKVFDSISFELHTKSRVALIGKNGTGKTTVFKIIAGLEDLNDGQITFRKGSTVGYLDQIPDYPGLTGVEVLKLAFKDISILEDQLKIYEEKLQDYNSPNYEKILKEYGEIQLKYEHQGGYTLKEKIDRICSGFKFDEDFLKKEFDVLSGGEKTRIILGKILLEQPSILLLDEPTNHLDLDTVEWLEAYLKEYEGAVLIISHDRYFLDHVVNEIYEIENGTTQKYLGNYSYYVEEKERRILEQLEKYKQQQKKIKSMEEAIKRFRDWGTRVDNEAMFVKAKAMEKRIERMDKIDRPKMQDKKMGLKFNEERRTGKDVVIVDHVTKVIEGKLLLDDASMYMKYQDYIALLGKNGSGKTTLLKMILKQIDYKGNIRVAESAKIGYMEQEIRFEFPEKSILDGFKEKYALTELDARNKLARFLFYADDVFKKIGNLSGGEKVRLSLCMMMEEKINFLILDEPTNHVDIDSREMIEQALKQFTGSVLFISHDRYFINRLATKVVRIEDKKLVTYDGDYQYFREELEKKSTEVFVVKKEKKTKEKVKSDKPNMFKAKALTELENNITSIESAISEKKNQMVKIIEYEVLMQYQEELDQLNKELDLLMSEWLENQ